MLLCIWFPWTPSVLALTDVKRLCDPLGTVPLPELRRADDCLRRHCHLRLRLYVRRRRICGCRDMPGHVVSTQIASKERQATADIVGNVPIERLPDDGGKFRKTIGRAVRAVAVDQ